jgi:hypothetical protein
MIKGVMKVRELAAQLEKMQPSENVAVMLFTKSDCKTWNNDEAGQHVPMDLGSFLDAMSEGSAEWIDPDYTQEDIQYTLGWVPPSWIGGKYNPYGLNDEDV